MQAELARLVYPVIERALRLREQLERGAPLSLATEQASLKQLLLSDTEAKRWADFGGEPGAPFLGVRYALVCWLDELFVGDSPWDAQWNETKLELFLYGTNDRAWRFWDQARLAEARSGSDTLEVFFLCVMLGFRGDLRGDGTRLEQWVTATRTRIGRGALPEWMAPPELDPVTHVPPLRGPAQMQQMVLVVGMVLLVLLPVVALFVVQELSR